MSLVRVENVSKEYLLGDQRVAALHDVTLSIEEGVFLAIAGPSGSGKSTLLNLIGCIDTPTTGRVSIDGGLHHHDDRVLVAFRQHAVLPRVGDLATVRIRNGDVDLETFVRKAYPVGLLDYVLG